MPLGPYPSSSLHPAKSIASENSIAMELHQIRPREFRVSCRRATAPLSHSSSPRWLCPPDHEEEDGVFISASHHTRTTHTSLELPLVPSTTDQRKVTRLGFQPEISNPVDPVTKT